jgi:hypothetical protein
MNGENVIKIIKSAESQERGIRNELILLGLIDERFTGSITLHFTQGGLSEIDRLEKNLRKKLLCDNKV